MFVEIAVKMAENFAVMPMSWVLNAAKKMEIHLWDCGQIKRLPKRRRMAGDRLIVCSSNIGLPNGVSIRRQGSRVIDHQVLNSVNLKK